MNLALLEDGSATPEYGLANIQRKYYLITPTTTYEIPKPDGWTGLDKTFKRSLEWHGFLFEGAENHIIKFHQDEGKQILEDMYTTYGQDAYVLIREMVELDSEEAIQYEGRLDFNKWKYGDNTVEVGVERKGVEALIQSRWDTKVSLNDNNSIDGVTITSLKPEYKAVAFHSKALLLEYQNINTDLEVIDWTDLESTSKDFYIQFNTQNPQKDEIQQSFHYPMGVSVNSPSSNATYLFKNSVAGNFTFDLQFEFQFKADILEKLINITNPEFTYYAWSLFLRIGDLDIELDSTAYSIDTEDVDKILNLTYSGTHYVNTNVNVYLYCKFFFTTSNSNYRGIQYYMKNINTSISIEALTSTTGNFGYGFETKETLNYIVGSLTGGDINLVSDFYTSECGNTKLLSGGLLLRYLNGISTVPELPTMTTSMAEIMKSLHAVDGIGFGYEYDGVDQVIRIEPLEYFYQDVEIISLNEELVLDTYSEDVAVDLVYSDVQVGFTKYPKEDTYGKDEFNTEHDYKTPIKYHTNNYDIRSSYIGSGYIIENQRRKPLLTESKESTDYDDDNFFVCVETGTNFTLNDIECRFREPYIFSTGEEGEVIDPIPVDPNNSFLSDYGNQIVVGSEIVISGTVSNNGTFTVVSVEFIASMNTYVVNVVEHITEEYPVVCDIEVVSVGYVSEKDTLFTTTNLIDSATSYNLRINPKYNLLNHAKWINGGLKYKGGSEKLQCKKVVQNETFSIDRTLAETCIRNDSARATYTMKEDIVLNNFAEKDYIFSPERITIQAYLQPEQVKYIINCHRGLVTGKEYGFITIVNPRGEEIECWLERMTELENGQTMKVELSFIKKKT
jgi:hypothetical protein